MKHEHPFISYLERLKKNNDRGTLAALRKGAGKTPGTAIEQYPYVVPWIPKECSRWTENVHYLIAGLYALHPDPGGRKNIGEVFRILYQKTKSDSIEDRFVALLNSHPEDLPKHLRHAVSLAKSKDIPIDWHQLFRDVKRWNASEKWVQKRWAKAYWEKKKENIKTDTDNENVADKTMEE